VVDDEVMVMRVAQASLERSGYAVVTAQSGPQAIEMLAKADAISAVVLDLKMPGMSGEDALREIRRLRPEIEVLIATAYDEEQALRMVAGMGVAGIIQKPFTPAGLVEKVNQVLR
jgi:CheY-like chemotaxis protein